MTLPFKNTQQKRGHTIQCGPFLLLSRQPLTPREKYPKLAQHTQQPAEVP
ncbi:kinetochore-associated protein DSN1 homolog [Acetobacter orientalis]|uniref:Kinetochore-associated protein DSN1 homolog n=1 Tax=Acetobacter orientalis TaxID=146474 RepID=A0A2Z5ZDL4_9PROT|nr:kinetochore-associated protein DSN1 homolog [Acetobacter orientalis]